MPHNAGQASLSSAYVSEEISLNSFLFFGFYEFDLPRRLSRGSSSTPSSSTMKEGLQTWFTY